MSPGMRVPEVLRIEGKVRGRDGCVRRCVFLVSIGKARVSKELKSVNQIVFEQKRNCRKHRSLIEKSL